MRRISLKRLIGLWSAITLLTLPLLIFGCGAEEPPTPSSDEMETTVARAVLATQTADAEAILGPPKTETAIAKTIFATQTAQAVGGRSATEIPVPVVAEPTHTPTLVPPTATGTPISLTFTPLPTATDTPVPPIFIPILLPTATVTPFPLATIVLLDVMDVATCWSYNPAVVDLNEVKTYDPINPDSINGYIDVYTLNFGAGFYPQLYLYTYEDAQDAHALFMRHTEYCRIGHGNPREDRDAYIMEYFKGSTGIETTIGQRDCVPYHPDNLQTSDRGEEGWWLDVPNTRLINLDNGADARAALFLASQHKARCFIGRHKAPKSRLRFMHEYWE